MKLFYTDRDDDVGEEEGLDVAAFAFKQQRARAREEEAQKRREEHQHASTILDDFLTPKPGARRRAKRNERLALKRASKKPTVMTAELTKMVGEMNLRYTRGELQEVKRLAQDIMVARPECQEAWTVMAEVCEEEGNVWKALDFRRMAAELDDNPTPDVWINLCRAHREEERWPGALKCIDKAIRLKKGEPHGDEYLWLVFERAVIFKQMNDRQSENRELKKLLKKDITDPQLVTEVTRHFYENQKASEALQMMQNILYKSPKYTTLTIVNMMTELLTKLERHGEVLSMLGHVSSLGMELGSNLDPALFHDVLPKEGQGLPAELEAKKGITHIHMKNVLGSKVCLAPILQPDAVQNYVDIIVEAADAYMHIDNAREAAACYESLLPLKEENGPDLWSAIGLCYQTAKDFRKAKEWRRKAHEHDPSMTYYAVLYAESLILCNEHTKAREILQKSNFDVLQEYVLSRGDHAGADDTNAGITSREIEEGRQIIIKGAELFSRVGVMDAYVSLLEPLVDAGIERVVSLRKELARVSAEMRDRKKRAPGNGAATDGDDIRAVDDTHDALEPDSTQGGLFLDPVPRSHGRKRKGGAAATAGTQGHESRGAMMATVDDGATEADTAAAVTTGTERAVAATDSRGVLPPRLSMSVKELEAEIKSGLVTINKHTHRLLRCCIALGKDEYVISLARKALMIPECDLNRELRLELLRIKSIKCEEVGAHASMFSSALNAVQLEPMCETAWEDLSRAAAMTGREKNTRSIAKASLSSCDAAKLMFGHASLAAADGNPADSLRIYSQMTSKYGHRPSMSYFLASALLRVSMDKKRSADHRRFLALGASLVSRYRRQMEEDTERMDSSVVCSYNTGKAFHFLGMTHLAVHAYRQVLKSARLRLRESSGDGSGAGMLKSSLSNEEAMLVRAAAHNLQLIYRSLGNVTLATAVATEFLR